MFQWDDFSKVLSGLEQLLQEAPEELASIRLSEDKWSLKEIVGHMIDSASNNHQRVTRLQEGNLDGFPAYNGESWIKIEKTNEMEWDLLRNLWREYNRFFLQLIRNIPESALKNIWTNSETRISLEDLVIDYYRHLGFHLDHFRERLEEIRASQKNRSLREVDGAVVDIRCRHYFDDLFSRLVSQVFASGGRRTPGGSIREYLQFSVAIDHDVIDGAPAAQFVSRLIELMESGYGLV